MENKKPKKARLQSKSRSSKHVSRGLEWPQVKILMTVNERILFEKASKIANLTCSQFNNLMQGFNLKYHNIELIKTARQISNIVATRLSADAHAVKALGFRHLSPGRPLHHSRIVHQSLLPHCVPLPSAFPGPIFTFCLSAP